MLFSGVNAFDYMILARMVYFFIPSKSICGIRASRLALCFVLLDIFSFMVQVTGGTMITGEGQPEDQIMRGIHIYMGGIGLQELFIVIFSGIAIKLHRQLLELERAGEFVGTVKSRWRWLLFTIYVDLILITVSVLSFLYTPPTLRLPMATN